MLKLFYKRIQITYHNFKIKSLNFKIDDKPQFYSPFYRRVLLKIPYCETSIALLMGFHIEFRGGLYGIITFF